MGKRPASDLIVSDTTFSLVYGDKIYHTHLLTQTLVLVATIITQQRKCFGFPLS